MKLALVALFLYLFSFSNCNNSTGKLKTIELTPRGHFTGRHFFGGRQGNICIGSGGFPGSPFSAGSDQVMVGFDNFHEPGQFCSTLRALTFRGLVDFDVSQFDSIVTAHLSFEAQHSVERTAGQALGQNPPKSFANALGMALPPITPDLLYDGEAPLSPGYAQDVPVTIQVKSWLDGSHALPAIFVLAGPYDLPSRSNFRENNDVSLTWYGNFKLRIVYSPAANPRAPQ